AIFKGVATLAFVLATLAILLTYTVALGKPLVSLSVPVVIGVMAYYVAKNAMTTAQSTFEAKTETARAQIGNFVETAVRVALTVGAAFLVAALAHGEGPLVGHVDAGSPVGAWIVAHPSATLAWCYAAGAGVASIVVVSIMVRATKGRGR